jgi:hypothetical protein
MPESHKICTKCGETKPLSDFYREPTTADGHRPDCKECKKSYRERRWQRLHPGPGRELSETYTAIHLWNLAHFSKTGICEECGAAGKTQFAQIHDRPCTRDRENFRELCPRCHVWYDNSGERNHMAKLTAAQVVEIRRRYTEGGVTQSALGTEFGVTHNQIQNIIKGRTWKALL